MSDQQSVIKKAESALDDFIDLWNRRKIVCVVVLLVIALPTITTLYLQFKKIPSFKNQVTTLEGEKQEAVQKKDKAEIQLAPFLAVAERNFPNTPSDQSLDLLLSRIDKAITDAFRYSLPPENLEGSAALFSAVKFFVDQLNEGLPSRKWDYQRLVLASTKGLSTSVIPLLKASRFKEFLLSVGVKVEVMSFPERRKKSHPLPFTGLVLAASNRGLESGLHYVLYPNLELRIGEEMLRELESVHSEFKRLYTEVVRDAVRAANSK